MCAAASTASYRGSASKKECEDLLGELESKARELHKRFNQIFHNRKNLSAREVKEYVKTFNQQQTNLKKFSSFGKLDCERKYKLQAPEEVYAALNIKVTVQIQPVA
jgi:chemotaxis regulatin CheY-phosphate phosphatase CheZ